MKRTLLLSLALFYCSIAQSANLSAAGGPTVYVAPDNGFEVSLAAAMEKKSVPVQIVANEAEAEYILRPLPIAIHKESGAGKIARCAFAYCWGIEDSGEVSVQLIRKDTERIVWAYQVNKQRGVKTRQAMAEAIAKHMRKEVFEVPRSSGAFGI